MVSNDVLCGLRRYLTAEQLSVIAEVKVGIAGAGGLGSNCAQMLVRSGFISFVIADFDTVDWSNLNRQFYFADQIGAYKAEALKSNLRRINPDATIEVCREKLDSESVAAVFQDCNAVAEGFDMPEAKSMLVQALAPQGKFIVTASGIAGWGDSDAIVVRKVNDHIYVVGDGKTDIAEKPPLAPRVQLAAAKQADLILAYALQNWR